MFRAGRHCVAAFSNRAARISASQSGDARSLEIRVLLLVADLVQEVHPQVPAVELAGEVEQVHLEHGLPG